MKNKLLIAIAAGSLLTLAACSGLESNFNASTSASSDPSQQLLAFSLADLQAADKIAKANGDTVAATCYDYLIPKVQAIQTAEATSTASVAGAASFAEVSRGLTVQMNNAKSGLNVACAPLVLDTANTALQLAGKISTAATAVATGGAALQFSP